MGRGMVDGHFELEACMSVTVCKQTTPEITCARGIVTGYLKEKPLL